METAKNREGALTPEADFEEEDSMKDRYLAFQLASEDYGIAIEFVTEIVGMQKISAVPDMPDFIRGVINLRGQVIPVMDVRTRFRMPEMAYNERTCIVVVKLQDDSIGLVVDAVKEVTDIPESAVSQPAHVARNDRARYIRGIGKVADEVKILLDVNKLLFENEANALKDLAA